ncbi:MAG TPA: GNAT family N-acetyltransferase [Phycisphaerae bacterium]|nr:GNAT family N-acetyltransferase [Phycisphaerae bacterium]
MIVSFTRAASADEALLLEMMRAFYAEEHLRFDPACAAALRELLIAPTLGLVTLIHRDAHVAGYFVLTFSYSLERGGKTALLDELFILPPHRRQGLAKAALQHALTAARTHACHALHLEVAHANAAAQALYAQAGYTTEGRDFWTLRW